MLENITSLSEERLTKELAVLLHQRPDAEIKLFDILLALVTCLRLQQELLRRLNQLDAKGQGLLITVSEAMRLTGLSRSSINRKMRCGVFMSIKTDGRRYIYRRCIDHWLRTTLQHRPYLCWSTKTTPAPTEDL
jgi:predicted DNA-binding transcriptional regulator AlpA